MEAPIPITIKAHNVISEETPSFINRLIKAARSINPPLKARRIPITYKIIFKLNLNILVL